jgi:HEAT repeat protein
MDQTEASNPTTSSGGEGSAGRLAMELLQAEPAKQERLVDNLRESKGPEHTQALVEAIPKLEGDIKKKARDALAERMARMTSATLRERLRDDDPEMRRAAALGAAQKEDTTHVPRLIELLDDPEATVSRAAYAALKSLSGKDFGPPKDASKAARAEAVAAWKAWWKEKGGK